MDFLSNGPIDLSYLNNYYKKELDVIINRVSKPAIALWDLKVKRMVYSIYSKENLEKSKISNILFDDLHTIEKSKKFQSLIFFIKSSIKMIDITESIINKNYCTEYHLVFVPQQLSCHLEYICKRNLESKFMSICQFQCYGVPLENDLISIENPDFIMNMNELSTLYDLAKTIDVIQSLYGTIPNVSGHGEKVQELMNIVKIMNKRSADSATSKQSKIHQMLIFDRRIDMLTPLLAQITYEGLLDELFKFSSGFIAIPVGLLNKARNLEDTELFQMNSSDAFYAEVRNLVIHEFMKKILDFHKDVEAEREKYQAMNKFKLEEMVEVANNLKSFLSRDKCAQFHFTLGIILTKYTKRSDYNDFVNSQNNFISQVDIDKVHPVVEEYITKKKDIDRVVQLICIQSLCANGLKPKILNWYKREILRTYGLQYAAVLTRLEKMGLLTVQQTSSMIPLGERPFDTLLTTLNLVPEKEDMQSDISNIYAGFVPIISRLVECNSKTGWQSISKTLALLPGQEVHYNTAVMDKTSGRKIVLVVYIGGVTFSEISTLRFLSQEPDSDTSYIVLTTGIINNVTYLGQLAQPLATSKSTNPFCD